ncbi:MAG: SCP2 sterol-binding domain-containing protein [Acidimicrobiia bacterium]
MQFLSPEWLAALGAACATATTDLGFTLRLGIEVTDAAPAPVRYTLEFTGATVALTDAEADTSLCLDAATARAIAQGRTNAQSALAAGRLTITGDVARLRANSEALGVLPDVFAAVRDRTEFSS